MKKLPATGKMAGSGEKIVKERLCSMHAAVRLGASRSEMLPGNQNLLEAGSPRSW